MTPLPKSVVSSLNRRHKSNKAKLRQVAKKAVKK